MLLLTGNSDKFKDFEQVLDELGVEIVVKKLELLEIQSLQMEEVMLYKAKQAFEIMEKPCLVDDTCIVFNAYSGFPGVMTKYVLKTIGKKGIQKLLDGESKEAEMHCYMGYWDGRELKMVVGKSKGLMDMDKAVKNVKMPLNDWFVPKEKMLHRKNAIEKLKDIL
jgi:non-canonical purine NTP pyrophosphatase (RdgB/HAM1 family)